MGNITTLLEQWHAGDRSALDRLMEVVYGELRTVADRLLRSERRDHTLEPTALVNEVYLRLEGIRELRLENRRHFYVQAPDKARVVELRYFGGLSVEETAGVLGSSPATVKRHWTFARAWLYRELSASPPG